MPQNIDVVGTIQTIHRYAVKSMGGEELEESVVTEGGLLGDRAYAVIDRIAVKKRGDNGPPGDVAVSNMGDIGALVIGTGVYVAFVFHLHRWLIGVPVVPGV